jgi:retron-type reverse transcriptase
MYQRFDRPLPDERELARRRRAQLARRRKARLEFAGRQANLSAQHEGDDDFFLASHDAQCRSIRKQSRAKQSQIHDDLINRIADFRTLRWAWHDCARKGAAPGVDGLRYSDFGERELHTRLRSVGDAIRAGRYRPGQDRYVLIPRPGKSPRRLSLPGVIDRVVGKAALRILSPLLDPGFDEFSFGFRPNEGDRARGVIGAVATAIALAENQERWVWVADDLSNAFDEVPINPLMDALTGRVRSDAVMRFIRSILGNRQRGIRQGHPLSPLLLNVFLDHHLDRRWRRPFSDIPLIRYADDILLLARSQEEAVVAHDALARLVRPIGMQLKHHGKHMPVDLRVGQLEWLGFELCRPQQDVELRTSFGELDCLKGDLQKLHEKADAPIRAAQVIDGWIAARGPSYEFDDRATVVSLLANISHECGFDQPPGSKRLFSLWRKGRGRFVTQLNLRREQYRRLAARARRAEQQASSGTPSGECHGDRVAPSTAA